MLALLSELNTDGSRLKRWSTTEVSVVESLCTKGCSGDVLGYLAFAMLAQGKKESAMR